MARDFTILSSFYSRESKALLELNYELIRAKNPGKTLPWVVADNTPPGMHETIDEKKFILVPGARALEPEHIDGYHHGKTPSCEHGVVLNNFHNYVNTRFALIVDNDFFIVREHWIDDMLEHMDKEGLTFFGSPFHPRYYHKLRYFPCPQLFFIDTKNMPMSSLNFKPRCDFKNTHAPEGHLEGAYTPRASMGGMARRARKIVRSFVGAPKKFNYHYSPFSIKQRGMIEGSQDTVTYLALAYRDDPRVLSECLQPVFKPWQDGGKGGMFYAVNRLLEFFLPDRFCFIPKRKGYFSTEGFKDRGYIDVQSIDKWWEELLWKNEPFGFHLRQNRSVASRGLEQDVALVRRIIDSFSHTP
jgi:hypothetical protein